MDMARARLAIASEEPKGGKYPHGEHVLCALLLLHREPTDYIGSRIEHRAIIASLGCKGRFSTAPGRALDDHQGGLIEGKIGYGEAINIS